MSEKKLKGVLFDFNGTLFFDSYLHIRAFEICFAKRGMSVPSAEFIVTNIFGISNENIYKTFFDPNATKDECLRFAEEKEGLYRSMCLENPSLMKYTEGACELMRYLKKTLFPTASQQAREWITSASIMNVWSLKNGLTERISSAVTIT